MNEAAPAPTPERRRRTDVVAMFVSLLALLVALHCRLYPNWRPIQAASNSAEALNERLGVVEQALRGIEQSLGETDAQGRSVADRLLVAENQSLLFDETLAKIVGHMRTLEDSLRNARDAR